MIRSSLFTAIVSCLALVYGASAADASSALRSRLGTCNSIVAQGAGLIGQINQGVVDDLDEACFQVLAGLLEFVQEGCLPPEEGGTVPFGSLFIQKISLIAPDTPALQNVCSAVVDTCGIPLLICPES